MVLCPFSSYSIFIWIYYLTITVKLRIFECAFILFSIFPCKFALAIQLIILKLALDHALFGFHFSLALPFSISKLTNIFGASCSLQLSSFVMHQSPLEGTIVFTTSLIPSINSLPYFLPPLKLTFIHSLFIIILLSIPCRCSIFPLSVIGIYISV